MSNKSLLPYGGKRYKAYLEDTHFRKRKNGKKSKICKVTNGQHQFVIFKVHTSKWVNKAFAEYHCKCGKKKFK